MRNSKIRAAVSAALALAGLAAGSVVHAAAPTLASCQAAEATANKLFVAGSSAAQSGFSIAIGVNLFGGLANELLFNGTNSSANSVTNFQAYCGVAASGNALGITAGNNVIVYYRAEGGSVSGALPVAAGSNPPLNTTSTGVAKTLQFLSVNSAVSNSLCTAVTAATSTAPNATTCNIAGTSSANGPTDSFGPTGLQSAFVDIGVTDVEPGILGTVNYPTAYSTSVYGSVTAAQLASLTTVPAFSQAFGFFINNSTFTGGATLDFSAATYQGIFDGTYSNWQDVPTTSGAPASTTSVPIKIVNREVGSGTRSSTNIFLFNYACGAKTGTNATAAGLTDGWATKEVLTTVGANPGAITYASIDNAGKVTNANIANLNGLNPTGTPAGNLLASSGSWPFWFEATYVENTAAANLNGGTGQDRLGTAAAVQNAIFNNNVLVDVATAPHSKQVGIIPGSGDNLSANGNVTGTASTGANGVTIYTNAFTRGGNSCAAPSPL